MSNSIFRRSYAGIAATAVLLLASVAVLPTQTPAQAGPGENFTLAKTDNVGGQALIGEQVAYTITATGNHTSTSPLYNLSFRDVLPAGIAFVSSDPAPDEILNDVPTVGQTTLVWSNVSDLPAGSQSSVSLIVDTNPDFTTGTTGSTTNPVGSTITNSAEAVASLDQFTIPDYDSAGAFTGDFDGAASTTHDVTIVPFRVRKTGADELLRGVHQNGIDGGGGTIGDLYTIEIENNPDYPTNTVSLTDTLHPGLEFLGCDTYYLADNSSAEEWTGSGPVATGTCVAPVQTPTSVNTGAAGETIVDWTLGNLTAGQIITVTYQAGIPLLANTPFSAPPDPLLLTQGRNLDNNTGPSTGEPDSVPGAAPELLTASEQVLDNVAAATGTFTPTGTPATISDTFNTQAEDLQFDKTMSGALVHGTLVTTTLTISASEYRDFGDLVVRDLLPSALCFIGTFNVDATASGSDWQSLDCPGAGSVQSTINGVPTDAAQVQELPTGGPYGTGRFEVVWDFSDPDNAALANLASDGTITIEYTSVVREFYRGNMVQLPGEPVLAGDSVTNNAEVSGPDVVANPALLPADSADPDGGVDGDTASSSLENSLPTINKRVSAKVGPMANGGTITGATCATDYATITWAEGDPVAEPGYGPGDIVCFELGASFPASSNYEGTQIQDLMPTGYEYIAGSAARIASIDTLPGTTVTGSGKVVTFAVSGSGNVDGAGNEFRWVAAAQILDNDEGEAGDIDANLQKLVHNNNGGLVFQLRDAADVEWAEPQVQIAKGVSDLNDGAANGPDFDGSLSGGSTAVDVVADDVVTYRVDVWNTGNVDALSTEIQDVIPTNLTCLQVTNITNGGTCTAGRITWPNQTVPASTGGADTTPDDHTNAPLTLTYDLTIPNDVGPAELFINTAGVATYRASTNTGDFEYYPANNIDPTNTALENTDAASDQAFLRTEGIVITKLQFSAISEGGNISRGALDNRREEATIGEIVQYEVTVVIPEGITVYDAAIIEDVLPTGMTWFAGLGLFNGAVSDLQPAATGTPTPTGTLAENSGVVTYTFPTPYINPGGSGDDIVTITFYAVVDDVAGNVADPSETRLRNEATFDWIDSSGNAGPTSTSDTVRTDVVEPNPQIDKVHVVPAVDAVAPGQTVDYQITVTNPDSANHVSTAHDITVVDTVPVGLTPLAAGAVPVAADGEIVAPNGVWSETNRTITWTPAEVAALDAVAPDGSVVITYQAIVDDPAVSSGTLENTASLTTYTLDQDLAPTDDPNEAGARSYTTSDPDSVTLPSAGIAKDLEPFNGADPADDKATFVVGEPVDYEVTVSIPDGTFVYDATIFDELPAFLDFDSFGTFAASPACEKFDAATGNSSGVALLGSDVETFNPVGANGQLAAWFLGDTIAVGGDCDITIGYTTHVNSTAVDTDSVANAATLTWNNTDQIVGDVPPALPAGYDTPASPSWNSTDGTASETFAVVEPALDIDKDVSETDGSALAVPTCDTTPGNNNAGSDDADGTLTDGCDTSAGSELRYLVTVANSGTSDAHDSTVVDTVPVGLTPLDAPGGAAVTADGDLVTGSGGSVGTWNLPARTITWQIAGPIAVGGTAAVDYDVVVDGSVDLIRGQDLTNTVEVTDYFNMSSADRTQVVADNAGNDDIPTYGNSPAATRGPVTPDVATVEVHFPSLAVDKAPASGQDATDVRLDQSFTWEITITSTDVTASAYNVDASDVLPEGWTYDAGSALVTTPYSGGAVAVEPTCAASTGACGDAAALNVETLSWTDLVSTLAQPLSPTQQIVISFTATPQSAALIVDQATGLAHTGYDGGSGFAHTNNVSVAGEDVTGSSACCDTDGPGGAPADSYADSDTDDVYIARADIEVAKSISPVDVDGDPINGPYWFGSFVNYSVAVTNAGPDEATGVQLSDVLDPAALAFDSVVSVDQGTFDQGTNIWDVGTVANGAVLTLTIRTRLVGLGSVTNIAQNSASDQYDPDSDPGNSVPSEDDQSEVTIEVVPTSLGDYVWLDLNSDGIQDGDEPGIPNVEVEITWLDPATGAPQSYTTTTGADGSYGVPPSVGLPSNTDVTVTINTAASPELTGLVQTFDRDATLDDTSTDQITAGDTTLPGTGALADLDYDFGYAPNGTQSIGNKVWWDEDNSGDATDGAGEYGLTGIDVTATWAGWDGVFGTADDLDFVETTVNGDYLFIDIPPGDYRVTVDTADLPAGLDTQTFDQDGLASASQVDVSLAAGENRLDVDFSYTGPASLGDTVWFDYNGDGTIDANEPGISGVTVTATWDGPDGIAGNGDDVVLTTTTAVDGTYSFDNLPYGEFVVAVDPASLPGGMTQTFDADGIATTNTSTVVLDVANPVNVDQDFGYNASGSIGDTVFFDVDGTETDGVPDVGDALLPGIDVTVVWAGADGIFGTADDFTSTETTDAAGNYLVDGLPHGDYTVTVDPATLPTGLTASTFDADGTGTANTSSVALDGANPDNLDQDFAYTGASSGQIGDRIWFDQNLDGIQDAGEVGFSGVEVTLVWFGPDGVPGGGDDVTQVTTTTGDGDYLFDNLPEGNFSVTVDPATLPAGLTQTFDADGTASADTSLVTLSPISPSNLDQDFGYAGAGSLGDTIWFDIDNSGTTTPDAGEPPLAGVDVTVVWTNPQGPDAVFTVTTDANGMYLVPNLPEGTYTVTVDPASLPGGVVQTFDADGLGTADSSVVVLDAVSPDNLDQDFSYTGIGQLGDTIWFDQDADGAVDPTGTGVFDGQDQPLANVDVIVTWGGFDGVVGDDPITTGVDEGADDLVYTATTDANGEWLVPNLPHGTYEVVVDPATLAPGITVPTYDADGVPTQNESTIVLDGAGPSNVDQDFSYTGAGSVGGPVWVDLDGDGVIGPDEVPIAGVTVEVTYTGPDGTPVTTTVVTGTDGTYLVENLPFDVPVTITVDPATLPPGLQETFDADGITTPHTSEVTLTPAVPDRLNQPFGYNGVGSLGDTVWLDADNSGTPTVDGGEVGIPNVTITVVWTNPSGGGDLTIVTTTDANGNYLIEGLPYGDYTVTVDPATLPAGMTPTFDADGTATPNMTNTTLSAGNEDDLNQDFSYTGNGSLGDTVWHDENGDGIIDGDETLLENVEVTITYVDPISGATFTETVLTGPNGEYIFENLPAGDYTVSVDPSTLPAGFGPTVDLDGIDTPHTASTPLADGEDKLDVDFGFRPYADLTLTKSHSADFAVGAQGIWRLELVNNGPAQALAPVQIVDTLPPSVTYASALGADWDCVAAGQVVTCTYVDASGVAIAMPAATTASVELVVDVTNASAGGVVNTATASSPTVDQNPDDNASTDTVVPPLSILDVEKTLVGSLTKGKDGTYEITVTNHGPSSTRGEVVVTDPLPAGLAFKSASTDVDGASCTSASGTMTCTNPNSMAIGGTWTITLVVSVSKSAPSQILNNAEVSGGNIVNGVPISPTTLTEIYTELTDPTSPTSTTLGIVVSPTATDSVLSTVATPPSLAQTGINSMRLWVLGLMLLAAGLALVLIATRRRSANV